MREVLPDLLRWWRDGASVGVGTVVATWRSAPRQPGASMLVGPEGEAVGSVSGGCVEGAVYELAQEVVDVAAPRRCSATASATTTRTPSASPAEASSTSSSRRSSQETFPELGDVAADIEAGRPVAVATVVEHPDPARLGRRLIVRPEDDLGGRSGSLGSARARRRGHRRRPRPAGLRPQRDPAPTAPTASAAARGCGSSSTSYAPAAADAGLRRHRLRRGRAPGSASSSATTVTVCDARPVFATASRFPEADEVVVDWPHRYLEAEAEAGRIDRRTVLCVLTHDPKFDVPLLEVALRLPEVAYIGAMGSRRTHDDRLERLREVGMTEAELARLSSPIGLDLGARTPEETAVSIAAEIIALRWGGQGARLGRASTADPPPDRPARSAHAALEQVRTTD